MDSEEASKGSPPKKVLAALSRLFLPSHLPEEWRRTTVRNLVDGAGATRRFYVLLSLSTTIAAFGLLANSAAVIIGAMIVAPLMGPILGLSLGMVSGDHKLERNALVAEVTGVALAIAIGFVIGHFPLTLGVSSEMLSRTSPTVFDLFIAFASGLVGGYASVNPKANSAFAGVSISVALVPPLATSGLLAAAGNSREAFGAFLLFLANFFCIQVAAALIFILFGLARRKDCDGSTATKRMALRFTPGVFALLLMGWYMTGTLSNLVQARSADDTIRATLSEQIAKRTGGRLEQILHRDYADGTYVIVASALTPQVFQSNQVAQVEADLANRLHHPVSLVLRSIVSQDMNREGRVYLTNEEREQSAAASEEASYLSRARASLARSLQPIQGAWLSNLERSDQGGRTTLTATVQGPQPLEPADVKLIQEQLATQLGDNVHLIVRNVSTNDVDQTGPLYKVGVDEPPKISPQMIRMKQRIGDVLKTRMALKPARRLVSLDIANEGGRTVVRAVVEATLPVRPEEAAKIEADLKRFVDPHVSLVVRTNLAAEASSSGWTATP